MAPGGLGAVTRLALAHAQAEREPLTTHAETQPPLRESLTPILAVPIRRTRRYERRGRLLALGPWARLCLISPLPGERGRLLMEPGGRNGLPLQGLEREHTKPAVEMGGTQGLEELPQPVIMQRGSREAGLEQGEQPTLLQASPDLVEGLMPSQTREEPGLHPAPTREAMGRVRRAEGSDERRPMERAYHPEHQRHRGHGTALWHRDRQEAPRPQVF
jgi:hypothetical protein